MHFENNLDWQKKQEEYVEIIEILESLSVNPK